MTVQAPVRKHPDEIEMTPMSEAFFECWYAAVNHLDAKVDGGIQAWLRCDPHPPFI